MKAALLVILSCLLCTVRCRGVAGNIKMVAMNGNQYWFSSSSPYAPHLNFHLAYQYCRTLGLQLAVLETKEEVEIISSYLNSLDGKSLTKFKYWTSGNKLGANSWIWMSSGEQMNNSLSSMWPLQGSNSEEISSSSRNCLAMKATIANHALLTPEECTRALPFICEQVRCLYYNYPVTQYPDPNEVRSDIPTEDSGSTDAESRSILNTASSVNYYLSYRSNDSDSNTLQEIARNHPDSIDSSLIQRRITLRPSTKEPYVVNFNSVYDSNSKIGPSPKTPVYKPWLAPSVKVEEQEVTYIISTPQYEVEDDDIVTSEPEVGGAKNDEAPSLEVTTDFTAATDLPAVNQNEPSQTAVYFGTGISRQGPENSEAKNEDQAEQVDQDGNTNPTGVVDDMSIYQRSKYPISWKNHKKSRRVIFDNTKADGSQRVRIIANSGPTKISLGPRVTIGKKE